MNGLVHLTYDGRPIAIRPGDISAVVTGKSDGSVIIMGAGPHIAAAESTDIAIAQWEAAIAASRE